jgi:O-antigen ligase
MTDTMPKLTRFVLSPLRAIMVLLAVSIPISVALDNVLLALFLLLGLLGLARPAFSLALHNPVARAGWLLFGLLALATLYGATPWREALGVLAKYDDLALVPLFMTAVVGTDTSRRVLNVFMLTMAAVLVMSYLLGLGVIQAQSWMWHDAAAGNAGVFHSYITQSMMTSYAVYLALLHVRDERAIWKRAIFAAFALLGAVNVLFLLLGRTGYLVLFALLAWFSWSSLHGYLRARGKRVGWPIVAFALVGMAMTAWGAYHASSRLHERVDLAVSECRAWQPNVANQTSNATSIGERLEFYYNTFQIIRSHWLAGVGTGGFPEAYARQVADTGIIPTHNPHNEYLLLTVQAGLIALLLMGYWLYTQWRNAPRLENALRCDAARGLVIVIAVSCLVNSSLLDHTEGLFFAFMGGLLFANLPQERA